MDGQTYSIWDFKKVTSGSEVTIYYNDFIVFVKIEINSRNFANNTSWTQVGTMSINNESLRPPSVMVSSSNNVNLDFSIIQSNGAVQYRNKSNTTLTAQSPIVTFCYPRRTALL